MLDRTIPRLIFIRCTIWTLKAITPFSIFWVSFSIAEPPQTAFRRFLLTWSIIETGFWLLGYLPRKRMLQAPAQHPPVLDKDERQTLYWKCWDKTPHPENYLSKWFLGAKVGDIKRDNVRDFFAWAFLNRIRESEHDGGRTARERLDGSQTEEEEELDEYVDGVQTLLGRRIEPGRGGARCLRLTIDQVSTSHRPFLWYMIVMLVDTATAARLRYRGFALFRTHVRSALTIFPPRPACLVTRQTSPAPDLSYWYRAHTSRTKLPLLFIHGIGIGLHPYTSWLEEINKQDSVTAQDNDIGIIAIEIMPVSSRICAPIPNKENLCRQINMILERHNFSRVVLASHSYGSVIAAHLLHNPATAAKIGPLLFVDPVTFLLHLPDVAYNFTARQPRGANEHQLHYFASTDMMVAQTLARHFFWSENILWMEDLRDRRVTISLGGRDLIIDTETVGKFVNGVDLNSEDSEWKQSQWTGNGTETIWWPTADHAQIFERKEGQEKLAHVIREYAKHTLQEGLF